MSDEKSPNGPDAKEKNRLDWRGAGLALGIGLAAGGFGLESGGIYLTAAGAALASGAAALWRREGAIERRRSAEIEDAMRSALRDMDRQGRLREIVSTELQKEREIAQSYSEMANIIMAAIGPDGSVEMINRKGLDILGIEERDALGENFVEMFVSDADKARIMRAQQLALGDKEPIPPVLEFSVKSLKGEKLVRWSNSLSKDASGKTMSLLICGEDITERREQENRLHMMRKMLEGVDEGVFSIDPSGTIIWANPASGRIFGCLPETLVGIGLSKLYPSRAAKHKLKEAEKSLAIGEAWKGEVDAISPDGKIHPQKLSLSPIFDGDGKLTHSAAVFSDITKEKEQEENIRYLASHDSLTGLPNRASFASMLDSALERAEGTGKKMAILFIDLDHFKKVNDTLGHASGDKLLIEVAQRLRSTMRQGDFISRLGGDEFTILLENLRAPHDAEEAAKKVIAALSKQYDSVGTHEIRVTPSIGICMYPEDGSDAESLLRKSDQAMYAAKKDGRAALRFFSPDINAKDIEHLVLENNLRKAIEKGEIEIRYQPKVDLRTGKTVGFEALARWTHKDLGEISPEKFIPLAEESGLIVDLGFYAVREACEQLALWKKRGIADTSIAVNFSAKQFREEALREGVKSILRETKANPAMLQLELTETAIMADANQSGRLLRELKDMGVTIAIDDFGTGYSSLLRLKEFPIDCVKIEKAFVSGIPDIDRDTAICKAIVDLGHNMGIRVIAEGVENAFQESALKAMGADEAQGFLYSKAIPAEEAMNMILEEKIRERQHSA